MDSNLQLGPFVLRIQWLVIILSMLVGYIVIRYRLKRIAGLGDLVKDRILETIEKSILIAILTWKFSLLLFDPIRVVTNPSSLLYYSGGERGIGLAIVVVLLYYYYHSRKERISLGVYGDLLTSGFLVGMVMYNVVALFGNQHWVWVYGSEILLGMLLFRLYFRKGEGTAELKNLNQAFLWFSLGQVFISFLNPLKQNFWWGFSKQQMIYLILAAICIIIDFIGVKNRAD